MDFLRTRNYRKSVKKVQFTSQLESQKYLNVFSLKFGYSTFISSGTFLSGLQKGFVELPPSANRNYIANNNYVDSENPGGGRVEHKVTIHHYS